MKKGIILLLVLTSAACAGNSTKMPSSELYLTERMATILLQQGNAAEAESAFRRCLVQDPDNAALRNGHGLSLLMLGRAEDALVEFNKAVSLAPASGAYLNNRGAAKLELRDDAGAEADFLAAYKSPNVQDRENALVNLGKERMRRHLYKEAQDALTRALLINPKSFQAFMARGATREALNDESGAVSDFLEALRVKPEDLQAMLQIGLGLITLRKEKLGRDYLRRVTEIAPDSPQAAKARLVLGDAGGTLPPLTDKQ